MSRPWASPRRKARGRTGFSRTPTHGIWPSSTCSCACRERQPHQKIVVLSNYATPDIRSRCAQLGVDAVFDKSNEIDALMDYCMNIDAASLNQLKTA